MTQSIITLFSIYIVVLLFTAMTSYFLISCLRFSCVYWNPDQDFKYLYQSNWNIWRLAMKMLNTGYNWVYDRTFLCLINWISCFRFLFETFLYTSGSSSCELSVSFLAVKCLPIKENQILVCAWIMFSKTLIFAQIVLTFALVQPSMRKD